MEVITIDSSHEPLNDEARAALAQADVITGVDALTDDEYTVFGTPPLESTMSLKRPAAMRVVQVRIQGAAGLKALTEVVRAVKGSR